MYFVYVLKSKKTGRFYTGSFADLDDRLGRHNRGESLATRAGVPWEMVHNEQYETRSTAMQRERYLKSGHGRNELRTILSSRTG